MCCRRFIKDHKFPFFVLTRPKEFDKLLNFHEPLAKGTVFRYNENEGGEVMYKIGDRVVYPMQGAGTIISKEVKELLGRRQEFYILQMPIANIRISIPVEQMEKIGIRPVMSHADGERVMEILRQDSTKMAENWSQRYRENLENLKTGDPFEMADVVRNLQIRDMEKGLSTSEKKMLNKTKKMLISELIIVGSLSVEEAGEMIDEAITLDEDVAPEGGAEEE